MSYVIEPLAQNCVHTKNPGRKWEASNSPENIEKLTMTALKMIKGILFTIVLPSTITSFVSPFHVPFNAFRTSQNGPKRVSLILSSNTLQKKIRLDTHLCQAQVSVRLEPQLDDDKITALFAWISRAYAGDPEYNNLMLAIAAIFGDLPEDSEPVQMAQEALKSLPEDAEERPCGTPHSLDEREMNSLGAMGAAQWTGRWRTRPHALLEVHNLTSVEDWVNTLPRGCKRTLKRAKAFEEQENFTVSARPILGNQPAPHSALAHFRCVVEHEVRLIAGRQDETNQIGVEYFFDALAEAVGRYMGTTRMTGEIREYRNSTSGKVIALAHEVRKGNTIRGQWFYATDEASKSYVWFHSVYDLVRRAIEADGVDVVDLGPSGSDAFSELKARYGFLSVDDWPAVADYSGPFYYYEKDGKGKNGISGLASFMEDQWGNKRRYL